MAGLNPGLLLPGRGGKKPKEMKVGRALRMPRNLAGSVPITEDIRFKHTTSLVGPILRDPASLGLRLEVYIFNKCSRRCCYNTMMIMMTTTTMTTSLLCVEHVLWPVLRLPRWALASLGFIPKWSGPRACAAVAGAAGFRGQDNYSNSPCSGSTYCVH